MRAAQEEVQRLFDKLHGRKKTYTCPVCNVEGKAYLTCQRPDCADGREALRIKENKQCLKQKAG